VSAVAWACRWIDVYGYDDALMETLAQELNLPKSVFEDVSFEQQAKISFYPEQQCMQFILHAFKIVNFPCAYNKKATKPTPRAKSGLEPTQNAQVCRERILARVID
jgi:hypothetical protein